MTFNCNSMRATCGTMLRVVISYAVTIHTAGRMYRQTRRVHSQWKGSQNVNHISQLEVMSEKSYQIINAITIAIICFVFSFQHKSYLKHTRQLWQTEVYLQNNTSMQKQKSNCPSKMVPKSNCICSISSMFQSAWLGRLELSGITSNQHATHCLLAVV